MLASVYKILPKLFIALLVLFTVLFYGYILIYKLELKQILTTDYSSYMKVGLLLQDGNKMYDINFQKAVQELQLRPYGLENFLFLPYLYLPVVGLFMAPLSFLPPLFGYKLMVVITFVIILLLAYQLQKRITKIHWIFDYALVILFFPVFSTLLNVQLSPFLAIIVLLVYDSFKNTHWQRAGVYSSLLLLKPQYLILVPFFIILSKINRQYIKAFSISAIGFLLVNVLFIGFSGLIDYGELILATDSDSFQNGPFSDYSIGFSSLVVKIANAGITKDFVVITNTIGYVVGLYYFVFKTKKLTFDYKFVTAVVLTLFFSFHTLAHDLVILLVPIYILIKNRNYLLASILFFAPYTLITGNTLYSTISLLLVGLLLMCGFPSTLMEGSRNG